MFEGIWRITGIIKCICCCQLSELLLIVWRLSCTVLEREPWIFLKHGFEVICAFTYEVMHSPPKTVILSSHLRRRDLRRPSYGQLSWRSTVQIKTKISLSFHFISLLQTRIFLSLLFAWIVWCCSLRRPQGRRMG